MRTILLADSGGTGTDWCYIDATGKREFFKTESYHPSNWNPEFWERLESFWRDKQAFRQAVLTFYGAGCLAEEKAAMLSDHLEDMGFVDATVLSDLHGAGKALFNEGSGDAIISGTGSVLFHYEGNNVSGVTGGKGHLEGDEGSAFYFGKLVLNAYQEKQLSSEQETLLRQVVDPEVLLSLEPYSTKYHWASLSKLLADYPGIFEEFHRTSIRNFIDSHINTPEISEVAISGSYGWFQRVLWEEELGKSGVHLSKVIQQPIMQLVEQNVVDND